MTESLSCSACTNETAVRCAENFLTTKAALIDGAHKTLDGEWQEITFDDSGKMHVSPADLGSALRVQSMLEGVLTTSLVYVQRELGCNLDEHEIDTKLMTEEA